MKSLIESDFSQHKRTRAFGHSKINVQKFRVLPAADAAADAAAYAAYAAINAGIYTGAIAIIEARNTVPVAEYLTEAFEAMRDGDRLPEFNVGDFYGSIYKNFQAALINCGCKYWADVIDHLYSNNFRFDEEQEEERLLRLETPSSIKSKGAKAVVEHMMALKVQGKKETREARIILLGSKGAGKTTLARKLQNAYALMPKKEKSTTGVDTKKLKRLISGEITHLWDFGGHVIIQAAHKCFLSAECVYVLVLDGRTEQQKDIDEYRKWLSTVKTYSSGNARVYIVLNRSDKHSYPMPEQLNTDFSLGAKGPGLKRLSGGGYEDDGE